MKLKLIYTCAYKKVSLRHHLNQSQRTRILRVISIRFHLTGSPSPTKTRIVSIIQFTQWMADTVRKRTDLVTF